MLQVQPLKKKKKVKLGVPLVAQRVEDPALPLLWLRVVGVGLIPGSEISTRFGHGQKIKIKR